MSMRKPLWGVSWVFVLEGSGFGGIFRSERNRATHGLKSRHLRLLIIRSRIIHRHASALLLQSNIRHQWYTVEGAVAVAKVQDCGPVV